VYCLHGNEPSKSQSSSCESMSHKMDFVFSSVFYRKPS